MSNVTTEELKEVIIQLSKSFDDKLDKQALIIGENIRKAFDATMKLSDKRIMEFEKEQTDRLLKVLEKYERKTDKHDRIFRKMKDEYEDKENGA